MKGLTRILPFAAMLIFLLLFLTVGASAEVVEGECGVESGSVYWSLDTASGAFRLYGAGAVADCAEEAP